MVTHYLNGCLRGIRPRQRSAESLQPALILPHMPQHRFDLRHEVETIRFQHFLFFACETHVMRWSMGDAVTSLDSSAASGIPTATHSPRSDGSVTTY